MIVFDLVGENEADPRYKTLETSNAVRHYDFLRSIIESAIENERPFLSQAVLKSLNHHAITCLHSHAGQYRPCPVFVGEKKDFPAAWQIPGLMDDFVNQVNRHWGGSDPILLAAFVLWRLNRIHPFINGNGRTARAACLFVICVSLGGWLPHEKILPVLIRENRAEYVEILKRIDAREHEKNLRYADRFAELYAFLLRLLTMQTPSAT